MSIKSTVLLSAALLAQHVAAHGFVSGVLAGGKYYPGQSHYSKDPSPGWLADNGDNGFASSLTDSNIICHNNAKPGTQYVAVKAGDSLELQWNTWPESHKGPMLDYLAPCGGECTSVDKTSLKFTKIDEAGLIDGASNHWASDDLIANNFTWVTKIPASIAPGKYVLRHETIALHSAQSQGGAQAYPQCINIEVSGSGTNSLSGGTAGTALYTPTDPGIMINIYTKLTDYKIPGPAVMAGGSGSDSGSGSGSGNGSGSGSGSGTAPKPSTTSSVVVTATATSKNAVASTTTPVVEAPSGTGTSPSATATIGGRKYVCYEEL